MIPKFVLDELVTSQQLNFNNKELTFSNLDKSRQRYCRPFRNTLTQRNSPNLRHLANNQSTATADAGLQTSFQGSQTDVQLKSLTNTKTRTIKLNSRLQKLVVDTKNRSPLKQQMSKSNIHQKSNQDLEPEMVGLGFPTEQGSDGDQSALIKEGDFDQNTFFNTVQRGTQSPTSESRDQGSLRNLHSLIKHNRPTHTKIHVFGSPPPKRKTQGHRQANFTQILQKKDNFQYLNNSESIKNMQEFLKKDQITRYKSIMSQLKSHEESMLKKVLKSIPQIKNGSMQLDGLGLSANNQISKIQDYQSSLNKKPVLHVSRPTLEVDFSKRALLSQSLDATPLNLMTKTKHKMDKSTFRLDPQLYQSTRERLRYNLNQDSLNQNSSIIKIPVSEVRNYGFDDSFYQSNPMENVDSIGSPQELKVDFRQQSYALPAKQFKKKLPKILIP